MKRPFTASIIQEGDWYTAQCLDVDIASQGAGSRRRRRGPHALRHPTNLALWLNGV